jgi:hypothetical protein
MQQTVKKTQQKKQTSTVAAAALPAETQVSAMTTETQATSKKNSKKKAEKVEKVEKVEVKKDANIELKSNEIHISRARCEWYMRNLISDNVIEEEIKELKESLKTLTAEDETKVVKGKINELNKKIFRISHYAPTVVSIICDTIVKDLIKYGINQVNQSGKKTLDILHFQPESIKTLRYYSLISNSSILNNIELLKVKKADSEDVVVSVAEPDTMTFNTYIVNAINDIKKDNDTKIIVGTRVKKFLSDLVIELIKRIMVITKSLLKTIINVRTIVPEHIKAIVNILLLDSNASSNDIDELMKLIDLKMEEVKTNQKNEILPHVQEGTQELEVNS